LRNRIDEIDNIIVSVLALYQPEARDLRTMVSCLKATNEIDKLFNLSRSQVKEFKRLPEDLIDGFSREFLIPMQRQVTEGISAAFQILGQQDAEQVQALTETAAMAESQNGDIYKLVEKSVLSPGHCTQDGKDHRTLPESGPVV
jgi:phosphate transport system protein